MTALGAHLIGVDHGDVPVPRAEPRLAHVEDLHYGVVHSCHGIAGEGLKP